MGIGIMLLMYGALIDTIKHGGLVHHWKCLQVGGTLLMVGMLFLWITVLIKHYGIL